MDGESFLQNYTLEWYEFIIFGAILVASLGIGVLFRSKNTTNEEFLMGGRTMSVFPVALSLICSFISAITLLGNPVEIYFYGAQFGLITFAFIPMTIVLAYIFVPVFFQLRLISAYQYFELRFSLQVRVLISLCAIAQLLTYMPTTVWGPSLALAQVAGINPMLSAAAIFIVSLILATSGGLKAVLWSNVMQALVILGAIMGVAVLGVYEVGGLGTIWETAAATNRTELFNLDMDLRSRHTFWTTTVGGFFFWLPLFAATQAQIQRYNSVPTLRKARLCLFFNMIGLMTVLALCSLIGLVIYTKYATCDPIMAKRVTSADQLLPLFTMDVLRKYPGLPGLLVAGLTCGSLSTVSSVLNSLSAIIVEDFVKWWDDGLTEIQLGKASKIATVVTGLLSFALIFVVAYLNDVIQIQPFAMVGIASLYGPILGALSLGMLFPWSNNAGALWGILVSIALTGSLGVSPIVAGKQGTLVSQKLFLTTGGCNASDPDAISVSSLLAASDYMDWKRTDAAMEHGRGLWNMSYAWQATVGCLTTVVVGLAVSLLSNIICKRKGKVGIGLLSKPVMRFWVKCFGPGHMGNWVEYRVGSAQPNDKVEMHFINPAHKL